MRKLAEWFFQLFKPQQKLESPSSPGPIAVVSVVEKPLIFSPPAPVLNWYTLLPTGSKPLPWTHILLHHSESVDKNIHDWAGIKAYHMSYRINHSIVTKEEFERRLAEDKVKHPGQVALPVGFEKPWSDIGYHLGTELVGENLVICYGRALSKAGAHCHDGQMNQRGIGLCVVGSYNKVPPSPNQMTLLSRICYDLIKEIPTLSVDRIEPHRKYTPSKTCPGTAFTDSLISELQDRIRKL